MNMIKTKYHARKFEEFLRWTANTAQKIRVGGSYEEALKDFNSIGLNDIKHMPEKDGLIGCLPDGKTINVRFESLYGKPTLEIYNPVNKQRVKVRYSKKIIQETWLTWYPLNELSDKYAIDSIEYTLNGGFKIIFSECCNKGKGVIVTFKHGVLAHREAPEIYGLRWTPNLGQF